MVCQIRQWYIHEIYAPGYYTGYGVKTLPAVREAIEQRDWKQANEQIVVAQIHLINSQIKLIKRLEF